MTSPQDPFSTPPPERQAGAGGPSDPGAGSTSPGYGDAQYNAAPRAEGNEQYGQQQYGAPPYGTPVAAAPKNGLGIAALVLGILALLTGWFLLGALFGLIAIVLGIIGRRRASRGEATNGGMALAGIVLGVLGILSAVFVAVTVASLFGEQFSSLTDCLNQADTQAAVEQCQSDFEQDVVP